MNFVNPLFFLGALAASVPILLHLIRRERARRIEFPTLMFLRRISKKSIRFQKLRHLLLLLLRILALLLLVFAFVRPFRDNPQAVAAGGRPTEAHILLLDNSLSMGYGDRWQRAKAAAVAVVKRAEAGDKVALLEFSDQVRARTELTTDSPAVVSEIENRLELSDRPTRYGQALRVAEKVALDAGTGKRFVHLISDFQKNGWAADEQAFRLSSGILLEHVDVGSDEFSNLSIGDVHVTQSDEVDGGAIEIKAAVLNFGAEDRKGVKISLSLDDRVVTEKLIEISSGGVQGVDFELPALTAGLHVVALNVDDARLQRDNQFLLTVEARGRTPVLCVEDPRSSRGDRSPSFFLTRALNISSVSPYRLTTTSSQKLESIGSIQGALVIWNNAPGGGSALQRQLQDFVKSGGGLIIVLADQSMAADFNRSFGTWLPVREEAAESNTGPVSRRQVQDYALLTDIRLDHPIFRPFSAANSGSFSTARFFKRARLSAQNGAEVLARFDDGAPALLQVNLDKGRVLVFASSADDSTNDLPLKAVYAPLWQQMLRFVANVQEGRRWIEVGDVIAPKRLLVEAGLRLGMRDINLDQSIVVMDSTRQRVPLAPGSDAVVAEKIGLYEVRTSKLNTSLAVNPVPRESDLAHGDSEQMVAGWLSQDANAPPVISEDERLSPEEIDRTQNFWRYLLLAAVLCLLAEGVLANHSILKPE